MKENKNSVKVLGITIVINMFAIIFFSDNSSFGKILSASFGGVAVSWFVSIISYMSEERKSIFNFYNAVERYTREGKDGKWYTYLPDQKKGRVLKKRTSQKDIEDDVNEYLKSEMEKPTSAEVFNEWNDRRSELKKISNATHLRKQTDI